MGYKELENDLKNIIDKNNVSTLLKLNKVKKVKFLNKYNVNVSISFPGSKMKVTSDRIYYDYDVLINDNIVTSSNIFVDLYNKATALPALSSKLKFFLTDVETDGIDVSISKYRALNEWKFKAPADSLINFVNYEHESIGHENDYDKKGNSKSYSLEELAILISLLSIKDGLNDTVFQGNKTMISLYKEAVDCAWDRTRLNRLIERSFSKAASNKARNIIGRFLR